MEEENDDGGRTNLIGIVDEEISFVLVALRNEELNEKMGGILRPTHVEDLCRKRERERERG